MIRRAARWVETGFERLSTAVTRWAGTSLGLAFALGSLLAWAALGPVTGFSPAWQMLVNTGTTIVTFLMVFLIQRSQNKDSRAIQLKLDELVAAVAGASNRLINIEDLTEEELEALHQRYQALAARVKEKADPGEALSVEETAARTDARARARS